MKIKERDKDSGELKEEYIEISKTPSENERLKAVEDAIIAMMGL